MTYASAATPTYASTSVHYASQNCRCTQPFAANLLSDYGHEMSATVHGACSGSHICITRTLLLKPPTPFRSVPEFNTVCFCRRAEEVHARKGTTSTVTRQTDTTVGYNRPHKSQSSPRRIITLDLRLLVSSVCAGRGRTSDVLKHKVLERPVPCLYPNVCSSKQMSRGTIRRHAYTTRHCVAKVEVDQPRHRCASTCDASAHKRYQCLVCYAHMEA